MNNSNIRGIFIALLIVMVCSQKSFKEKVDPNFIVEASHCLVQNEIVGKQLHTTIPTNFHLDLLRNKLINDPFFSNNYESLRWVSKCNAVYKKNITFSEKFMKQDKIMLVFQGIDTYSTIYFNGKIKQKTNNAFVEYRVQIAKDQILPENQIKVEIQYSEMYDEKGQKKESMPFIYAHTRKPCYQYSWDWAPYLNSIGIWKPIYIEAYTNYNIDYVWARNKVIQEEQAIINFAIALKNTENSDRALSNYKIRIKNENNNMNMTQALRDSKYNYIDFKVTSPQLWWPNGIGQPYIYNFTVELINDKTGETIDTKKVPYGIRTTILNQQNNQFTLVLNGYNIYCKGANYVPPDMFYPRLHNPDYQPGNSYQQILDDAVQSHYNMIRIWGGGQYQTQQFLQLASRKGIMIFYDFMFSDSIYPGSNQFLSNFQTEAKQQIIKARNYPCVVLWSGNNEIYQGILSWGWRKGNYQANFKALFVDFIPKILDKYHPDISYISSSPVNGVGNSGFNRGGDIHYWGVWAGSARFQSYKTAIGPFNSQFGTQSLPVWETILNFTSAEERKYESPGFAAHERHNSKFNTLKKYHKMYAHEAKDFESQAYLSGLVQAYGIQLAIKYQRMAKPKSYGTLYWQMNDAWPAISWSSIDYFGRWKPLQYMAKRSYPDIAVFADQFNIKAINDNLYPIHAIVLIKIQQFNGKLLFHETKQVYLQVNEVKSVMSLEASDYRSLMNEIVIYTEIIAGREKQMWSTTFLAPFSGLSLQPSTLYVQCYEQYNMLIVSTDKFIKNLYISHSSQYIKLSDNYFDMIANKKYKILLDKRHKLSQLKGGLIYRSYMQIHEKEPLTVDFKDMKQN